MKLKYKIVSNIDPKKCELLGIECKQDKDFAEISIPEDRVMKVLDAVGLLTAESKAIVNLDKFLSQVVGVLNKKADAVTVIGDLKAPISKITYSVS